MDSDILRWLLLIIAVAVLFLWYMGHLLLSRRKGLGGNRRVVPVEADLDIPDPLMAENSSLPDESDDPALSSDNLIIIAVDCKHDIEFSGANVLALLGAKGLTVGKYLIYHRYIQHEGSQRIVYSVINGVEPGHLDDDFASSSTPSIMFFLDTERSYNPLKAFAEMLESSQDIAAQLSGSVCDSDHNPLTEQTVGYIRETIREKERNKHLQTGHS